MLAALKGTMSLGCLEKRKDRKARKSRSERKVVGFSSASLFLIRKWEAVPRMEPEDRSADAEDNPGSWYR